MRQGQRRKRPALFAARTDLRRQPFRTADHEIDVARIETPAIQLCGQLLGAPWLAMDLQRDDAFAGLNLAEHGLAFLADQPCYIGVFAAGLERDFHQLQRQFGRQTLDVLLPALLDPARHTRANGDEFDPHGWSLLGRVLGAALLGALPQALEVVELA